MILEEEIEILEPPGRDMGRTIECAYQIPGGIPKYFMKD
jgi:hypothetical protein